MSVDKFFTYIPPDSKLPDKIYEFIISLERKEGKLPKSYVQFGGVIAKSLRQALFNVVNSPLHSSGLQDYLNKTCYIYVNRKYHGKFKYITIPILSGEDEENVC